MPITTILSASTKVSTAELVIDWLFEAGFGNYHCGCDRSKIGCAFFFLWFVGGNWYLDGG